MSVKKLIRRNLIVLFRYLTFTPEIDYHEIYTIFSKKYKYNNFVKNKIQNFVLINNKDDTDHYIYHGYKWQREIYDW